MHQEIEDAFYQVGRDPDVSAVVLTGAGRGFCSGGDVRAMDERGGAIALQDRPIGAISPIGRRIVQNILWVEQPVICALNGVAAGLGATLALFCDVIYASDRARIGDTHVRAGLVAGDGGAVIWPLLVGVAKAKELLMTGDIIDATEAERIGLVNRVVPHDDLMETVMELAQRLADGPALAIRGTKHAINKKVWNDLNQAPRPRPLAGGTQRPPPRPRRGGPRIRRETRSPVQGDHLASTGQGDYIVPWSPVVVSLSNRDRVLTARSPTSPGLTVGVLELPCQKSSLTTLTYDPHQQS